MLRYFAVYNAYFLPKFLREKQECALYMGSTNSVSIEMFLILLCVKGVTLESNNNIHEN